MREQRLTDEQFQNAGQHLAHLVEEFEHLPYPAIQEKVFDLLHTIDALHREALTRLVTQVRVDGGHQMIDRAASDPVARTLLELYDLAHLTPREQADAALDSVRPYLRSHGGEVEVLDAVGGTVYLRLSGTCDTCPASALTLSRQIESALREGFPGFHDVRLHEDDHTPDPGKPNGFVPLAEIRRAPARRNLPLTDVGHIDALPEGSMMGVQAGDGRLLLAHVDGTVFAFHDQCPGSIAPLSLGTFKPPVIICPWHNDAFDVRTGRRVDGQSGADLTRVPVTVVDDIIRVAVPSGSVAAQSAR
jgi:Fe-S cluster biogenesis protein NfuA/nitrite reductase/ring-hydroxylating ferredoxin subunit